MDLSMKIPSCLSTPLTNMNLQTIFLYNRVVLRVHHLQEGRWPDTSQCWSRKRYRFLKCSPCTLPPSVSHVMEPGHRRVQRNQTKKKTVINIISLKEGSPTGSINRQTRSTTLVGSTLSSTTRRGTSRRRTHPFAPRSQVSTAKRLLADLVGGALKTRAALKTGHVTKPTWGLKTHPP